MAQTIWAFRPPPQKKKKKKNGQCPNAEYMNEKGSSQNYHWSNLIWASYSGQGSTVDSELHFHSSFQVNGSFCLQYVNICIFISSWLLGMVHKTTLSTIQGPIHNVMERDWKLYFYKSTLKLKIDQSEALCLLKFFEKVAPRAPFIDTKISVIHGCVGLSVEKYIYVHCMHLYRMFH